MLCARSQSYVGFEVFTAVVMKNIIFWDVTPCSPLSFNRRFGGTYSMLIIVISEDIETYISKISQDSVAMLTKQMQYFLVLQI
jgi:hypothetical protein